MAIVVLALWAFTAGAGFLLLVTSSLGRTGPPVPVSAPAPAPASAPAPAPASAPASSAPVSSGTAPSGRAARDRWAPPSLVAARQAPIVPSAQSLAEFAHPALAIIGLAFWLGFTLVHNRILGWIGFGLVTATACVGLAWFTSNTRAARRVGPGGSAPSFSSRLVALHGSAAAITVVLAALTGLVLR